MFDVDLNDPFLLFPRQAPCISCPTEPAPCNCGAQPCERIVQTCNQCAINHCVENPDAAGGSGGVSAGALAGTVVGCVIALTLVVTGFFLWRRRARTKKAAQLALEKNTISPFDLNGPSVVKMPPGVVPPTSPGHPSHPPSPVSPHHANGDVRVYNGSVINLDPSAAGGRPGGSPDPNPFSDSASVSTLGTNVIPIAYVPPSSTSMTLSDGLAPPLPAAPFPPTRPARSPDLNLRAPPNAVSRASLMDAVSAGAGNADLLAPRSLYAAPSAKSGVSGVSAVSSRASTISSASSVLYERPVVQAAKVGRQVLGVVRAEVVAVPSAPNTPGLQARTPTGLRARASVRSPLAGPSFNQEDMELQRSPSPPPLPNGPASPSMSVRSNPFSDLKSTQDLYLRSPVSPTSQPLPLSRPGSTSPTSPTLASPTSPASFHTETTLRPQTSGRLLTPMKADYPPMPPIPDESMDSFKKHAPRESTSSFISATSRADSIINGFTFLPPTPGSAQTAFQAHPGMSLLGMKDIPPEDVHTPQSATMKDQPGRRTLAYSTVSNASNMSSGLDAFTFHFGESSMQVPPMPHTMSMSTLAGAGLPSGVPSDLPLPVRGVFDGGQRASLDTLALSRDVEAYPLGFDRDSRR